MARDYLLDTNILRYWFDKGCAEHAKVSARVLELSRIPRQPTLFTSAIVIGEVEYGHQAQRPVKAEAQLAFVASMEEHLAVLDVRRATALEYGRLRADLFEQFSSKTSRKGLRPEQLVHPVTAKSLGIQENDLWIAAQAIEYDLTLVTHDSMRSIVQAAGGRLRMEDWAA